MPIEPNRPIVAKPRINAVAQYLIALAAVIALYSGYLKFAVPAIEGPGNLIRERNVSQQLDELQSPLEDKSYLIPLLPPDAWELQACTTLLVDSGTILYTSLDRLEDGSLQIKPFTLISGLDHSSQGSPANSNPPTVLRCLAGAKLKFNKPFRELFTGNAKMESARLNGRVDIYRPPTQPNKNDAIHFITSNVRIDKQRVYTLEGVEFEFGSTWGSGRNLSIDLAHEDESSALIGFSNINGIRRLELAFLDKLRIEPSATKHELKNGSPIGFNADTQEPDSNSKLFANNTAPLEITCKGPFVFDFKSNTASFRQHVVAEQMDDFRDNIRCDELTLVFEDKTQHVLPTDPTDIQPTEPRREGNQPNSSNLHLERFIAKGSPAIVVSNSKSAKIRSEYLSYNLLTNQIDGRCGENSRGMITVDSPEYQMAAKQLRYRLSEDGSLGEVTVTGPGRLRRVGKPDQDEFYSVWNTGLTTRNVLDQPGILHIAIDGSAEVRIAQQSSIRADRIEMLVWQIPKVTTNANRKVERSWEYLPSKLVTTGAVTIVSPKLDGQANHLTAAWPAPKNAQPISNANANYRSGFRGTVQLQTNAQLTESGPSGNRQLAEIPRRSAALQTQTGSTTRNEFYEQPRLANRTTFVEQTGRESQNIIRDPNVRAVGFDQGIALKPKSPKRKLNFKGETVDIRLAGTDDASEIRDLTVVGNVLIESIPIVTDEKLRPPTANQQNLTINCHRLQLTPQEAEGTYRTLVSGKNGAQATVNAKDFVLAGQDINLDQSANKVWVEGSGSIALTTSTLPKTLPRNPTIQLENAVKQKSTPENLNASWTGGMIFDGTKIYFESDVVLTADRIGNDGTKSTINSLSEGMSIELSKPVKFKNLQSDSKIGDAEVREIILVEQVPKTKQVFKMVKHPNQLKTPTKRPVVIENQTYNLNGELSEQQKITVPKAVLNRATGSLESQGPGTISIHRRGKPSTDSSSDPFARLARQDEATNDSGITFIQINFDGQLQVDTVAQEMQLDRNIRTIYSPVKNWDVSFNPDDVLPRTTGRVFMTCEHLQLAQWTPRTSKRKTSEIIATGNTHIFSDTLDATAHRVSYDRTNDTLIIVGTPRSDANLRFKQTPNDTNPTHLVAKKITYRIKDQATGTYGLETLNVNRD